MTNKIRYKILKSDLTSPYQGYKYEIGKWYEEPRVGEPGANGCVRGLYAVPIEGLIYRGVQRKGEQVYRCEINGKQAGTPPLKECWEKMRVLEPLSDEQVRRLAKCAHKRLGWLLEEALYPVDPRTIERGQITDDDLRLLLEWDGVWNSVGANVRTSVGDSVGDSVGYGVWNSVGDIVGANVRTSVRTSVGYGVGDSLGAYIGSLFPSVTKWHGVEHAPGEYPFASGSDLWRRGLVPSYDGMTWRLHAGPLMGVVWSGTVEELTKKGQTK